MRTTHRVTANTYWMAMDLYMFRTAGGAIVACRKGKNWSRGSSTHDNGFRCGGIIPRNVRSGMKCLGMPADSWRSGYSRIKHRACLNIASAFVSGERQVDRREPTWISGMMTMLYAKASEPTAPRALNAFVAGEPNREYDCGPLLVPTTMCNHG